MQSKGDNTIISKGIFTTCKKNDDCPPWQIKAGEISHDKERKVINYKNAKLKIYDVPVLYFPRFFHPDPTVKRQSGFLIPKFQDNSTSGLSLTLPYFLALAENRDMTFTPRLFNDDKFLIQIPVYSNESKIKGQTALRSFEKSAGLINNQI